MTESPDPHDWSDVDSQEDPDHFTEYLEQATGAEVVLDYKRRSHDSLQLEAGDRVLDIGCGIGEDALMLAEHVGTPGEVVGIDKSEAMIRQANARGADNSTVSFEVGDIYAIDYPRDWFDASRADRVFQHLEDPAAALAELMRVTRPGGRIGLTDPDWESIVIDVPGDEKPHELLDPAYANTRNPAQGRQLYRLARNGGLVDIAIDPVVFYSTNFEFARNMGDVDTWLANMAAAEVRSQRELDEWSDQLRRADEAGQFFTALVGYSVTGTMAERT